MKLRTQVVHALVQDARAWLLRHEGHIVQLTVPGGQGLPDAAWHCRAQINPSSANAWGSGCCQHSQTAAINLQYRVPIIVQTRGRSSD